MPDKLDAALLELLRENARRSNRDIAQRLGVAESTVALRIRRLEQDGVLVGYHARIRSEDRHLVVWAAIELDDVTKRAKAAAHLRTRPEVTIVEETFGDFDLVFRAECDGRSHWATIEADLVSKLSPLGRLRGGFAVPSSGA